MENYIASLLHWEILRHGVEAGQVAVEADEPGDYQVATLHIVLSIPRHRAMDCLGVISVEVVSAEWPAVITQQSSKTQ